MYIVYVLLFKINYFALIFFFRYILNNPATLEAIPKKRGICRSWKIYSFVTLNALLFLICGAVSYEWKVTYC